MANRYLIATTATKEARSYAASDLSADQLAAV